ncbi:hypothetical protein WMY93_031758 [Mugilogobius chulae]|uniref:DNAJC11-like beta-barrel domain-containing protein n=1 Tax=Mugilogobius chulae TaxID=88201 RepID=A0AAW0MLB9_9GOBI
MTQTVLGSLGVPHSYLMLSYQYKFQDEDQTKVKGSLKTGWFGTVVEYGAERKISRHSVLSATVSVGVPQGVTLKIRLSRASQTYLFPVHLTDQLLPSAVFYATVGPLLFYLAVHRLVVIPFTQAQKEQELELQRINSATDIAKKKQEAESAVLLMQESVKRIIDAEESKMGGSPWFLRPLRREEKSLKLLYQFRGVMHQVLAADTEPLRIPKQSHRIESSSSESS